MTALHHVSKQRVRCGHRDRTRIAFPLARRRDRAVDQPERRRDDRDIAAAARGLRRERCARDDTGLKPLAVLDGEGAGGRDADRARVAGAGGERAHRSAVHDANRLRRHTQRATGAAGLRLRKQAGEEAGVHPVDRQVVGVDFDGAAGPGSERGAADLTAGGEAKRSGVDGVTPAGAAVVVCAETIASSCRPPSCTSLPFTSIAPPGPVPNADVAIEPLSN